MSAARQVTQDIFFRIFDYYLKFQWKSYLLRFIITDENINFSKPKPGINAWKIMLLYKKNNSYTKGLV